MPFNLAKIFQILAINLTTQKAHKTLSTLISHFKKKKNCIFGLGNQIRITKQLYKPLSIFLSSKHAQQLEGGIIEEKVGRIGDSMREPKP